MDFLLNTATGDLDLGDNNADGLQLISEPAVEATQRLAQALSLNLTEWFVDITAGLPYIYNPDEDLEANIRYFLGDKSPNAAQFVKATLDKYILDLPFITSLESSYVYDNISRTFIYTYAGVANGEDIEFPSITLNI